MSAEKPKLPFCTDCPETELINQVQEALSNPENPEYEAANVVTAMMRLAGCEGPNDITTRPVSDALGDHDSVTITVCQNPLISGAKDVMTHTSISLAAQAGAN